MVMMGEFKQHLRHEPFRVRPGASLAEKREPLRTAKKYTAAMGVVLW
jgi:hypothetical protein